MDLPRTVKHDFTFKNILFVEIGNIRHMLKGTVYEMDFFLKVKAFLSVLSVYALLVFKVFQKLVTIL
jgi:hypothetical protein